MSPLLYNHYAAKLSELDVEMISHVPPGGNWKDIPESVPSNRLAQIRKSGGRTTYYGRLRWDRPSYTISTYFNRAGNGCYIHPEQNRLISIREGARLQSFMDGFVFYGSRSSQYKQVGNAVPPLMARAVAETIKPHTSKRHTVDLFTGAGGMSEGFKLAGFDAVGGIEIERNFLETFIRNNKTSHGEPASFLCEDIRKTESKNKLIEAAKKRRVGIIIGGPPCQGFSLAGWRDVNDERNQLFRNFVEIVSDVKPDFFVMENVPGLLSMAGGKVVDEIVRSFADVGYYVNKPIRLKAEEFGVPQKRRRVFIIGSLHNARIKEPMPLFSESDPNLPKPITVKDAIYGLPPITPGAGAEVMEFSFASPSPYQRLLCGELSFEKFYAMQRQGII